MPKSRNPANQRRAHEIPSARPRVSGICREPGNDAVTIRSVTIVTDYHMPAQ
jgi:hypothetical protein